MKPINRRNFIIKLFSGVMGMLILDAFWFERYIINWTEYDISNRSTGKVKIVQLTDLHINEVKSFHRSIAKRINKEQPDILVITGDSVNYNSALPIFNEFLNLMDNGILKIAIMGNKEYWGNVDVDLIKEVLEKHNGELLINENCLLHIRNRTFNIIGLDDYFGGNADFYKAANNVEKHIDTIVLNHCPEYRDDIERINRRLKLNLKLILSGHTHGGQITFFGKALFKPYGSGRYVKGWYKSKETQMYVSKGIGTSVVPIRFGARAEATIFYI